MLFRSRARQNAQSLLNKEMTELEDDELPAGWLTNRVVRVVRYSKASGTTTAYRLIVEEN